jgi:hypothetical protein
MKSVPFVVWKNMIARRPPGRRDRLMLEELFGEHLVHVLDGKLDGMGDALRGSIDGLICDRATRGPTPNRALSVDELGGIVETGMA